MALGPILVAERLTQGEGLHGVALFMRHGETAWNREGRVMGASTVGLDEIGRAQVRGAVELVRALAPDLIFTSPLARARESAAIIAEALGGLKVVEEPDLEEVRYGRWQGMQYQQLIRDPDYIRYRHDSLHSPTPGGETIIQVQQRGVAAVTRAIAANPRRRLLFVSHGDIIRTVLCHLLRLDLRYFHRIRTDNAALSAVEMAGDFAEVKFLNLVADVRRAFELPFPTTPTTAEKRKG